MREGCVLLQEKVARATGRGLERKHRRKKDRARQQARAGAAQES